MNDVLFKQKRKRRDSEIPVSQRPEPHCLLQHTALPGRQGWLLPASGRFCPGPAWSQRVHPARIDLPGKVSDWLSVDSSVSRGRYTCDWLVWVTCLPSQGNGSHPLAAPPEPQARGAPLLQDGGDSPKEGRSEGSWETEAESSSLDGSSEGVPEPHRVGFCPAGLGAIRKSSPTPFPSSGDRVHRPLPTGGG